MSKGAIYHHFKSKEEILNKVLEQRSDYTTQMFNSLLITIQASNAREKLVNILDCILSDNNVQSMNNVLISQVKNPQFVVTGIKSVSKDVKEVKEGVYVMKDIIGRHQIDIEILKRRPV